MTIASMTIDPDATSYTNNEIVTKVNDATNDITRAGSVDAAARPIEAGEVDTTELADGAVEEAKIGATAVTNPKLATGAAKTNLDAMALTDRGYVSTNPVTGEYKITAIQRDSAGDLDIEYDDQPIP